MPHAANPARGWLGTCNHLTVGRDYPYLYTTYASPTYRYRRLIELMGVLRESGAGHVDFRVQKEW